MKSKFYLLYVFKAALLHTEEKQVTFTSNMQLIRAKSFTESLQNVFCLSSNASIFFCIITMSHFNEEYLEISVYKLL